MFLTNTRQVVLGQKPVKRHTISAQSVLRARTHRNLRSRTKFPETSALEFLHLLAFSIIISWILSGKNYLTDFLLQKKHVRKTHNFAAHTNIDNVTMTDNCGKKTCHFLVCYFVLTKKIIHFWKRSFLLPVSVGQKWI